MTSARYVYAIVRADAALPTGSAIGAARLALVRCRDLAAVTGQTAIGGASVTMEAMLHHEAVVEAVRRQGPGLPVRFGTVFPDATAVAGALSERYTQLAADLDRLGDKVELGLTALWAEPPCDAGAASVPIGETEPGARGAGARYLRARAAEFQRDEAQRTRAATIARILDQVVGPWALERRESLLPTPGVAVRMLYLLDPSAVDAFRRAFDAWRRSAREVRLLLSGPWPPYSFVGRTDTEGGAASVGRLTELAQILTRCDAGAPRLSGRGAAMDNSV